nr:MAG TPA: hypothetical protein [Caudoviricetes sp.]
MTILNNLRSGFAHAFGRTDAPHATPNHIPKRGRIDHSKQLTFRLRARFWPHRRPTRDPYPSRRQHLADNRRQQHPDA